MMDPGKLIHSVVIQKKIVSRNSFGEEVITWIDFTRAWASIEPLSGREYFQAMQIQAVVDHKISMWYQPGIRPDMRAIWNDRGFDIKSVLNKEERNIELLLMCQEFTLQIPKETIGRTTVMEAVAVAGEGLGEGPLGEGPLGGST